MRLHFRAGTSDSYPRGIPLLQPELGTGATAGDSTGNENRDTVIDLRPGLSQETRAAPARVQCYDLPVEERRARSSLSTRRSSQSGSVFVYTLGLVVVLCLPFVVPVAYSRVASVVDGFNASLRAKSQNMHSPESSSFHASTEGRASSQSREDFPVGIAVGGQGTSGTSPEHPHTGDQFPTRASSYASFSSGKDRKSRRLGSVNGDHTDSYKEAWPSSKSDVINPAVVNAEAVEGRSPLSSASHPHNQNDADFPRPSHHYRSDSVDKPRIPLEEREGVQYTANDHHPNPAIPFKSRHDQHYADSAASMYSGTAARRHFSRHSEEPQRNGNEEQPEFRGYDRIQHRHSAFVSPGKQHSTNEPYEPDAERPLDDNKNNHARRELYREREKTNFDSEDRGGHPHNAFSSLEKHPPHHEHHKPNSMLPQDDKMGANRMSGRLHPTNEELWTSGERSRRQESVTWLKKASHAETDEEGKFERSLSLPRENTRSTSVSTSASLASMQSEGSKTAGKLYEGVKIFSERHPEAYKQEVENSIERRFEMGYSRIPLKQRAHEKDVFTAHPGGSFIGKDTTAVNFWIPHIDVGNGTTSLAETFEHRLNFEVAPILSMNAGLLRDERILSCQYPKIEFALEHSPRLDAEMHFVTKCGDGGSCIVRAHLGDFQRTIIEIDSANAAVHYVRQHDYAGLQRRVWGPLKGALRISLSDDSVLALRRRCGELGGVSIATISVSELKHILARSAGAGATNGERIPNSESKEGHALHEKAFTNTRSPVHHVDINES